MGKPVFLHPRARQDIKDIYQYYESEQPGLGRDFVLSLREAKQRIAIYHKTYRIVFGNFKKVLLQRFPYAVYFKEREYEILVHAVWHGSRNPDELRDIIRSRW